METLEIALYWTALSDTNFKTLLPIKSQRKILLSYIKLLLNFRTHQLQQVTMGRLFKV